MNNFYLPNFTELDKPVEEGYLNKQVSPCCRLVLYNYTDKTTYDKYWNEHTLNNRGSVYEISTGRLVAKTFPKFFNYGELTQETKDNLLKQSFLTYDKLDGSCVICYWYEGEWMCNTRGSFSSDQAIKAKEMLYKGWNINKLNKFNTYIFECIYPENRIVLDYGNAEKLVLIGVYRTSTQEEESAIVWSEYMNQESVQTYQYSNLLELLEVQKTLPSSVEGFVVQFEDGTRVKFKGEEYMKLARIHAGITPLNIWDIMSNGKVDVTYLESIPEEFRDMVDVIVEKLESRYTQVKKDVDKEYLTVVELLNNQSAELNRKNVALKIKELEKDLTYSSLLMNVHNKKCNNKNIMRIIKPHANKL